MFSFFLPLSRLTFKRISTVLLVSVLMFILSAPYAEAKRLGGGRSIGRQSSMIHHQYKSSPRSSHQSSTQPQPAAQRSTSSTPTPPTQQPRNRWLGPIAGLAAGLGIAALLSHLGLGGALGGMLSNFIIIGLLLGAVYLGIRWFQRNRTLATNAPGVQEPLFNSASPLTSSDTVSVAKVEEPQAAHAPTNSAFGSASNSSSSSSEEHSSAPMPNNVNVPTDFDTAALLRAAAKVLFIRMQAAWDAGDLNDIREFTTPEMFAEIKLDLTERGAASNKTDVKQLEAELVGVEERRNASVRFSGLIEETAEKGPQPFTEIWNLVRREGGEGQDKWLLAGIQQVEK